MKIIKQKISEKKSAEFEGKIFAINQQLLEIFEVKSVIFVKKKKIMEILSKIKKIFFLIL